MSRPLFNRFFHTATGGNTPYGYQIRLACAYILNVHGYNMKTWEKDRFAETEYKRLYWQGYQGRFGAFNWPTAENPIQFGNSESQSWDSALGLLHLLNKLDAEYTSANVYLTVHSLGNIAAGEALRLAGNRVVNTYVAMQGAVSSHAYDPTTPEYTIPKIDDNGAPDCYAAYWTSGPSCYFNSSAGASSYVNFFNLQDWALGNAWLTFEDLKPSLNLNYSYTSPNIYERNGVGLYCPGDTYQIFANITQSRSFALGEEYNVGGVFSTANQIELDVAPYNFGSLHLYHSGEWLSDNQSRWQFWDQVLVRMKLKLPNQ